MEEIRSSLGGEKLLTVSVAAYNVEKTIERTLDSLVREVPEEVLAGLEVIVVNDGSKDDTLNILRRYEAQYPDTIRVIDKENGGWGSTINASLKMARGKYYRLLDGDDTFVTENLSGYIGFLRDAEADLILSPYVKRYPGYETEENHHTEIGCSISGLDVLNPEAEIYMHEAAVRTELIREKDLQITEKCFYTDNEYVFQLLLASETVQRFDKSIYVYHLGVEGQSVGAEGVKKHHEDTIRVSESMYKRYFEYLDAICAGKGGLKGHDEEDDTERSEREITPQADDREVWINGREKSVNVSGDVKRRLLDRCLLLITDFVYVAYLLMDTGEAKSELKKFDRELKEKYREIDRLLIGNKKIKMLRMSGFMLYRSLAQTVKKRYT